MLTKVLPHDINVEVSCCASFLPTYPDALVEIVVCHMHLNAPLLRRRAVCEHPMRQK